MTITRKDIEKACEAAFHGNDVAAMLAALDLYGIEPYEQETERVQLAIIELCRGSMAELRRLVNEAKIDYRNILAWHQTGPLSAADGEKLQAEARRLIERWGKK
jgi:hypothetical protein